MIVLTQANYQKLSEKQRSAIKAAQEFPIVYPNIKRWQRKVSSYALVERRIAGGLVETGWFEVRGSGWTLTQAALDLFDEQATDPAPAPSALSNGHKEAEMTENTSKNTQLSDGLEIGARVSLLTDREIYRMDAVMAGAIGTVVKPPQSYTVNGGDVCVKFDLIEFPLMVWKTEVAIIEPVTPHGSTQAIVSSNTPAAPTTPDSGRTPSRFAPTAGNTWRDHLNDEPALNVSIDDLMTDEQPSAPADDHKLPDDWEPSDELYIYQISWINKHGLEPIPPELDAMFKELCEVDDANEKLRAERDAALADAKALREKYNETAQRAIVLRESLELVLDRRNGHIVGTKHLHEADILQLEKALRAASADAGAKGENG